MAEGVNPDTLNIISLFMQADWVVKLVMIGLAIASLWSWAVILDKTVRFGALNRQADAFEAAAGTGRSLDDLAAQAGDSPRHPLPLLLVTALKDWRETRARGPLSDTQTALLMQRIDRALDAVIARENRKIEDGLGVLAVVATSSPFIGLFGTVWGIMHAFDAIAASGNTNLATVAPAIAEALFATAIGLGAAIPAYIAYNKFSLDASKFAGRMESFADDLGVAVAKKLGDRLNERAA
ncbi:protein TolQ [Caulobacter sp. 17J65-9]|uniref:protein TolQ n=1 Tax=Caulobacter sp. 17J65-9 TaxID=2709382 RepID=UPI0013C8F9B4|nr:protein TolQ [Caulobacter sp. 17J65-9]NEX91643.1 protein TolQ [Caulobacter sp. 17J65-9]